MSDGWIKIHRKMLEWEWWDEPNTFKVFMVLLLKTNHKDTSHRGVNIKRGQLKTGRKQLAEWSKLSEMKVRTALNNLVSTNDITINATTKHSIITITNWEDHQKKDTDQPAIQPSVNQDLTNDQPTLNQHLTTSKNVNNDKNVKNVKNDKNDKKDIYDDFVNIWNSSILGTSISKVQKLSTSRKKVIKARMSDTFENNLDFWQQACTKIVSSSFLTGRSNAGFTASFDWALKPANIIKILEGNYDDKTTNNPTNPNEPFGAVAARNKILSDLKTQQNL